jgi:hypothetical protein
MFRFTIRDVLWLTVVVALGVMMWLALRREMFPSPPYAIQQLTNGYSTLYSRMLTEPYAVQIRDDDIASTPRWDRRYSPPFPPQEAIRLADMARKRLIRDGIVQEDSNDKDWQVSAVELTPHDVNRGLWYWIVRFETLVERSGTPSELRLVVLMDGTVVEPRKDENYQKPVELGASKQ